ncbi:MAG TPA: manganese efflux pump, partial [Streptosporangiaceae bacterium]
MVALLLVAVALGLSNFAASIGLGAAGEAGAARVAVVFGVFEAGMPVAGLALGHGLARSLGHGAHWAGGALLIVVGGYTLLSSRDSPGAGAPAGLGRLVVVGFALSVDNLAAGFALGAYHVAFWVAAVVIGVVSVAMSLIGLKLGAR